MTNPPSPLHMPGGVLVTRLRVYDTPASDGQCGGTPHFHFLCTEMYLVLKGSGTVEMIDGQGFQTVELAPYSALVFSAGTLHRLINPDGDLEILVIMQNSGLPERGDNVVTFSDEWLADDEKYQSAMRVSTLAEAYQRRDRGVQGFLQIQAAFESSLENGQAALQHFFDLAYQRTKHLRPAWEKIIQDGAASTTLQALNQLHSVTHLMQSQHHLIQANSIEQLGFCGHLNRYFDPATLSLEGLSTS